MVVVPSLPDRDAYPPADPDAVSGAQHWCLQAVACHPAADKQLSVCTFLICQAVSSEFLVSQVVWRCSHPCMTSSPSATVCRLMQVLQAYAGSLV